MIVVILKLGRRLNKHALPTKMAVAMGPSYKCNEICGNGNGFTFSGRHIGNCTICYLIVKAKEGIGKLYLFFTW